MLSPTMRRQTGFVVVFLIVVMLFVTTYRMGVVHGESMETTYFNGQVVLVRRRNWLSAPLRRNDVVLVRKDRDVIIKRIYRLSGEEIDHSFPDVLRFSIMNGLTDYYEQATEATPYGPRTHYIVPDDYIVILGDNLRVSEDSRIFGPVPIRDILGVVVNAPGPPYAPAAVPNRPRGSLRPGGQTSLKTHLPHYQNEDSIVARHRSNVNQADRQTGG